MKKHIRIIAAITLIIMVLLMISGCGNKNKKPSYQAGANNSDTSIGNNNSNNNNNDTTDKEDDKNDGCNHSYGEWTLFSGSGLYCEKREYKRTCSLCGKEDYKNGNEIDHLYGAFWEYDGVSHWYECSICGKRTYTYMHDLVNDRCTICGYQNLVGHLAGTYNITMWVSEMYGVSDLFEDQIKQFEMLYPGISINAHIEGLTEADAGSQVISDVYSAPDIYCTLQDQIPRLVQVGALSAPPSAIASQVIAANDSGSIRSASQNGTLYAYPLTTDNGYYMYYDKSIITNPESLEQIIADCEASGKKIRFALENAWYNASFFFGTGCTSEWFTDSNGQFYAVNDTYNSEAGLAAMKGMQMLAQSHCYSSDNDTIDNQTAVIITGVWMANVVEDVFGENLAATDLPSFTVDGETYHLGSFSGNKLMCVKPQSDARKAEVLHLLAQYLSGEDCQMQRYDQLVWTPSNIAVQQTDKVQSNIHFAALAKQSEYAIPQGYINGSWWDLGAQLGREAKSAYDVSDLQAALNNYDASLDNLFIDYSNIWSVIGDIQGTGWTYDFELTYHGNNWYISDVLYFEAGAEFAIRRGCTWDNRFGPDGYNGYQNYVMENSGYYQIYIYVYSDYEIALELVII